MLPLLEDKLGPGVAESLARTAAILQLDADYLEDVANDTFERLRQQTGRRSAFRRPGCGILPRP